MSPAAPLAVFALTLLSQAFDLALNIGKVSVVFDLLDLSSIPWHCYSFIL